MIEQKEILVILGSPNSPKGALSPISKSRLDQCLNLYTRVKSILCTGGWGDHFNTAPLAHAEYLKQYLLKKGVNRNDFLELAISSNTVDDAVKIKPIIAQFSNPNITVITSDFHVDRVQLIFKEILKPYHIKFVGAKSNMQKAELDRLIKHEKKAINSIIKNGLYY
jgi:uncharacterized SAM-binding protein YcdF (DUF218 family)